jgi:hypothetical protein
MVRIVGQKEKPKPEIKQAPRLSYKSNVLLQVMGIIIADKPEAIRGLLEDYGFELLENISDQELSDKLLQAISSGNAELHQELAELILDNTLDSSYDDFDFKSLLGNTNQSNASPDTQNNPGGLLGNITSTVNDIGNTISQQISQKRQASSQTLQGIMAYRQQQAQTDQSKNKTKNQMLIGLFFLLGICVLAIAASSRRRQLIQRQQFIQTKPGA